MYTPDNRAPPTTGTVEAYWRYTQAQFLNAVIRAGSMDGFADELSDAVRSGELDLPVYDGEIGDACINGGASDAITPSAPLTAAALRQRGYAEAAAEPDSSTDRTAVQPCNAASVELTFDKATGALVGLLDSRNGREWVAPDCAASRSSAGACGLGSFRYRTYNESDFDYIDGWAIEPPVNKHGMDADAHPESSWWLPARTTTFVRDVAGGIGVGAAAPDGGSCSFVSMLDMPAEAHTYYGAPASLQLNVTVSRKGGTTPRAGALELSVELQQFNKTATRLAEASFMSFTPLVPRPHIDNASSGGDGWMMDILGSPVSPLNVAANGTRHLHAVWGGVDYSDANTAVSIESLDAPLVCPGDAEHLLRYTEGAVPDMAGGWHFNLYNNHWAVAFPQWFPFAKDGSDANMRFRFALSMMTWN